MKCGYNGKSECSHKKIQDQSVSDDWEGTDKPLTFKSDNVHTAIDKDKPCNMFRDLKI